ncbi:hypothetical protein DER45DRAFT_620118 [Fusarium avenaceum]|nr:hypothetical protein DER45DRAFT_620118 [Fusarium avenaceum]
MRVESTSISEERRLVAEHNEELTIRNFALTVDPEARLFVARDLKQNPTSIVAGVHVITCQDYWKRDPFRWMRK